MNSGNKNKKSDDFQVEIKNLLNDSILLNRIVFIIMDIIAVTVVSYTIRPLVSEIQIIFYQSIDDIHKTTYSFVDPFTFLSIGCIIYFQVVGLYSRGRPLWDQLRPITQACGVLFLIDLALLSISAQPHSICAAAVSWSSMVTAFGLARLASRFVLKKMGKWYVPTVILGAGRNAQQTAEAIRAEPSMGYEIRYFVRCPETLKATNEGGGEPSTIPLSVSEAPVVDLTPGLLALLRRKDGPHVIIALEADQTALSAELMTALAVRPTAINVVPPIHGIPLYGLEVNHLLARELLLLQVRNNLARQAPRLVKRVLDIIGALTLLVLLSPLLLLLAYLVRRTGRDVIYGHLRIGQNGKPFKCFKFRSMVPNAAEALDDILSKDAKARAEWETDFKLKNDPRITKVGRFLRRSSLDELPQLWNVIRGEMSLVGPRPVIEEELEYYAGDKDYYILVRPGITGLWQVSGRSDVEYEHRVFLDGWYVRNWSLWYDISILFRTIPVVFRRTGAY
jgi:undecaprenyl-phosphate galactose phosphotransferase